MKKRTLAVVATLAALPLWALLPAHANGGGGGVSTVTPASGTTYTIHYSGQNFVDVSFATTSQFVLIQASPNTTYSV